MSYEPMSTDTEMCCMIASELAPTDTEMSERQHRRYEAAADDPYETPPPMPPPLVRQNADIPREGVREQEIRYIEEYGLVAFCRGVIITAILQDADYLRAQLIYLGK